MSEPTIYYNVDSNNEEHVKHVENVMGILHYHLNNSQLCVSDCKDSDTGEIKPVICAIIDQDGKQAILPLAVMYNKDENVVNTLQPVNYSGE